MSKNKCLLTIFAFIFFCVTIAWNVPARAASDTELSGAIESVTIIDRGSPQIGRTIYAEVMINGKYLEKNFYSNLKYTWKIENGKNSNAFKEIPNTNKNGYEITKNDVGLRIKVVVTGIGNVTGTAEAVTEFAVEDKKFKVSFDANGADSGVVPEGGQFYFGYDYVVPKNASGLYKNGKVFAGWSFGDVLYRPGSEYFINQDTTFKAVWLNQDENIITLGNGDVYVNLNSEWMQSDIVQDKFIFNDRPGRTSLYTGISILNGRETAIEAVSGCKVETRDASSTDGLVEYKVTYTEEDIMKSSAAKLKATVKDSTGKSKSYEINILRPESVPLREMGIYNRSNGKSIEFKPITELDYEAVVTKDVRNISIEIIPENLFYKAYITSTRRAMLEISLSNIEIADGENVITLEMLDGLIYTVTVRK